MTHEGRNIVLNMPTPHRTLMWYSIHVASRHPTRQHLPHDDLGTHEVLPSVKIPTMTFKWIYHNGISSLVFSTEVMPKPTTRRLHITHEIGCQTSNNTPTDILGWCRRDFAEVDSGSRWRSGLYDVEIKQVKIWWNRHTATSRPSGVGTNLFCLDNRRLLLYNWLLFPLLLHCYSNVSCIL